VHVGTESLKCITQGLKILCVLYLDLQSYNAAREKKSTTMVVGKHAKEGITGVSAAYRV
jgi:hypothetical protein